MNDDEGFKLPKASLISAINGGENALKSIYEDNSSTGFNGYIKATMKLGTYAANGIIVVVSGKAEVAYFTHIDNKAFGPDALPEIFKITKSRRCVIKVYSFRSDTKDNISSIVETLANCRIDIDSFWQRVKDGEVVTSSVPGSGEALGDGAKPRVDEIMEGTSDAFKVIVGDGIIVVDDPEEEEDRGQPIDEEKISKVEEALKDKEELLRKEIDQKIEERAALKKEEEKFLKMDEVFSKLLKEREEDIQRKEEELAEDEKELTSQMSKKEKILVSKEKEIKKGMSTLELGKEEMKVREQKLHEMEKMFRRVLVNTEERLKKKEEELIMKEDELKQEVGERMSLIDDLKLREARVLEIEQQLMASENVGEVATEEINRRESRIKMLEDEINTVKEELGRMVKDREEHDRTRDEVVKCLKILDDLLGNLPEDIITEFSQSDGFDLYERIMNHFKLVDE